MNESGWSRWAKRGLIAAAISVVAIPTVAVAGANHFTDVDNTSIFLQDINWMSTSGVTEGCGVGLFCPKDNVTREQMAAFMHRLAINQVVDAGSVGGYAAEELQPALVAYDGLEDYDVDSDGTHVLMFAELEHDPRCPVSLFPENTIHILATGFTNNMNPGETAEFVLRFEGEVQNHTRQILYEDNGAFAVQFIAPVNAINPTFELLAEEADGDFFTVRNASMVVEIVRSRCAATEQ